MKAKQIVKRPPKATGDPNKDIQAILDYMEYFRNETNYDFAMIAKEINREGE
ncbi:MAG: hypothetical protein J6S60_05960 [Oscillospiraceae bacterium]|nr:hypothetical protein [Oscillospiraceae bacterium]